MENLLQQAIKNYADETSLHSYDLNEGMTREDRFYSVLVDKLIEYELQDRGVDLEKAKQSTDDYCKKVLKKFKQELKLVMKYGDKEESQQANLLLNVINNNVEVSNDEISIALGKCDNFLDKMSRQANKDLSEYKNRDHVSVVKTALRNAHLFIPAVLLFALGTLCVIPAVLATGAYGVFAPVQFAGSLFEDAATVKYLSDKKIDNLISRKAHRNKWCKVKAVHGVYKAITDARIEQYQRKVALTNLAQALSKVAEQNNEVGV